MRKLWLSLLLLVPLAANAQSVQQSGNVTPGHAACWAITGVVYDCGAPGGGVSVVGSTTTNDFVAFNASGSLIDSGVNPANTTAISGLWNFNGGATAPTRNAGDFSTNVATTAFVGAATANIFNVPQTVTGLWTFDAGTTAPLTDDAAAITANNNSSKTALQIYCPFSVNGCNPTTGGTEYDVGRFVLDLESAAGGTVSQANALGGYAFCNFNSESASYPGKGNCVSLSGFAVAAGQGANAWGVATFCADNSTPAVYVGGNRSCLNEFDIRIEDNTGTARGTGALISLVGSGTSAGALIAVDLENFASTLQWNFGVNCGPNATANACVFAGAAAAAGANVSSQAIAWGYTQASVGHAMTMISPASGGFHFATTGASVGVALDWTSVSITSCTLDLVAGCVINGNGAIEAFGALGVNALVAGAAFTAQGSDATSGTFAAKFQNSAATVVASFRDDGAIFLYGPISMTDSTASTSPVTGAIVNPGGLGVAGATFLGGKLSVGGQIISTFGVPTIASGACGTGTNGSISGTNQAGLITIGAAGTTTCTVSFSTTITAPNACIVTQSGGTAELTKVTSVSSSNFVVAGATMASTSYYYICI